MAGGITITVKDAGALRLLNDLPGKATKEIARRLDASGQTLESAMRPLMRQDTRNLMNSVHWQRTGLEVRVGPSLWYAYFQEYGRKPGKPPPISAIQGWANRHGIPPFLVARAIGRKGVKPRPFLQPTVEHSRAKLDAIWRGFSVTG